MKRALKEVDWKAAMSMPLRVEMPNAASLPASRSIASNSAQIRVRNDSNQSRSLRTGSGSARKAEGAGFHVMSNAEAACATPEIVCPSAAIFSAWSSW